MVSNTTRYIKLEKEKQFYLANTAYFVASSGVLVGIAALWVGIIELFKFIFTINNNNYRKLDELKSVISGITPKLDKAKQDLDEILKKLFVEKSRVENLDEYKGLTAQLQKLCDDIKVDQNPELMKFLDSKGASSLSIDLYTEYLDGGGSPLNAEFLELYNQRDNLFSDYYKIKLEETNQNGLINQINDLINQTNNKISYVDTDIAKNAVGCVMLGGFGTLPLLVFAVALTFFAIKSFYKLVVKDYEPELITAVVEYKTTDVASKHETTDVAPQRKTITVTEDQLKNIKEVPYRWFGKFYTVEIKEGIDNTIQNDDIQSNRS